MSTPVRRAMSFDVRRLGDDGSGGRWGWTVLSHPERAVLRGGQVVGDREKAERAARAAIAIMGGVVPASQ